MWMVVVVVLTAAPEFADPARKPLEHCRVESVSFRTAREAWLTDACGQIFRSQDGGRGWERSKPLEKAILGAEANREMMSTRHVPRLTWLSESIGLAFPYGADAVRTTDSGATWTKVSSGTTGYVYAVEVVGRHVWTCDSSGALSVSTDQGATWRKRQKLFDASGINPVNWCSGISFLDEKSGWALGWQALWQTIDGGERWTEVVLPEIRGQFEDVTRLTRDVAWIRSSSGKRFSTRDGGRSWEERPAASSTSVNRRRDGRAVLLAREALDPSAWEPSLENVDAQLDSNGAITVELLSRIATLRTGELLSVSSSERVPLRHVVEGRTVRWGAHERQLFRSDRGGEWYLAAELDSPVLKLAVLEGGAYLAQTASGIIKDGKRADAASIMDWDRLTGSSLGKASLACLRKKEATLTLEWEAQGCFGGTTGKVELTLASRGGRVVTTTNGAPAQSSLPPELARELAWRFAEAATEPEIPSDCWSTTRHLATLKWQCEGEPLHALHFTTSECGSTSVRVTGAETRSGTASPKAYSRTLGLIAVAQSLGGGAGDGR